MTFGEWLKGKLESEHWTQRQLAEYAGCSAEMIRSLIGGRRLPSFDMAIKVCEALAAELEEASWCDDFVSGKREADYHQQKREKVNGRKESKSVPVRSVLPSRKRGGRKAAAK